MTYKSIKELLDVTDKVIKINYIPNNKKHENNNKKSDTLGQTIKMHSKLMVQMLSKSK